MTKIGLGICLAYLFCLGCPFAAFAGVTAEQQRVIRENTFEVVMKKPEKDPVSYEKPLPLELIPYIERTDVYRSVGTAFALGTNTYVTAGHVFVAGIGSQFGSPALRRADGKVFEIDRILKFSLDEDFVVFSVRGNPAPAGFAVNRTPTLDEAVLAVGNALGEGIVIRDGLFTSETAEAQDGRWKWIRFSAAASPGNSGGPLCDANGQVIGIVIGKSPNENLNYSLPIVRVIDAPATKARFDQKSLINLPYMQGTITYAYKDEFDLPLAWPAFVQAFQKLTDRHFDEARSQLLKKYADVIFPMGVGSETLLVEPDVNDFRPRLIAQRADGTWTADKPPFHQIDLPKDGSVGYADAPGFRLLSLARPNAAYDDAFYDDSKAFMDLALKALDLRRAVGTDQVRVTSLGAAMSDALFTDAYGRKWQERVWPVPFLDAYLVGMLLPTPDGYAGLVMVSPSISLQQSRQIGRLLAAQVDVSYAGDLAQWRAALRRRTLLPSALSQVKLEKTIAWTLQTPRFVSAVPPELLQLTDESPLGLTMGFMHDGQQTVWDIQGVTWYQDDRKDAAIELWRRMRPQSDAKLELRNRFDSIRQRRAPFDGSLSRDTVDTYSASSVLDVLGRKAGTVASDLEYGVTVYMTGRPSSADVAASITRATAGTHVLEHAVGEEVARGPTQPTEGQTQPSVRQVLADHSTALPVVDGAPGILIDELQLRMSAWGPESDRAIGKDVRGRLMSEDGREFMRQVTSELPRTAASDAEKSAWEKTQRQRFDWLGAYWREYPALTHNRDMFVDFLAKNRMQPTTSHREAVLSAESALLAELLSGPPTEKWAQDARALRKAYVEERSAMVKVNHTDPSALVFAPRSTPCPPAATTTTGTAFPRVSSNPRSLEEYWPLESKRLGEEGTVIAAMRIASDGCLSAVAIAGSSGSDMLDGTVLRYLQSGEFIPAGTAGKPVPSQVNMPVVFKLD